MTAAIKALDQLIRTMQPGVPPHIYVYCVWPLNKSWHGPLPLATFPREKEGLNTGADRTGQQKTINLIFYFRARSISLTVHSDLEAVGLTAAFAKALADRGLSCNVFAGAYHDHLLVPVHQAEEALLALEQLQQSKQNKT